MQVSNVTNADGIACAHLIRAMQVATFNGLKEKDMEAFLSARKWLAELALQLAEQLRGPSKPAAPTTPPPQPAPSTTTMKVKAMGPIGGQPAKKRK